MRHTFLQKYDAIHSIFAFDDICLVLSLNHLHYITFSRRFYPKRLTVHSGYTFFFISMCVPLELNPQPFALLTQCSTTEPQEHNQQKNCHKHESCQFHMHDIISLFYAESWFHIFYLFEDCFCYFDKCIKGDFIYIFFIFYFYLFICLFIFCKSVEFLKICHNLTLCMNQCFLLLFICNYIFIMYSYLAICDVKFFLIFLNSSSSWYYWAFFANQWNFFSVS